MTFTRGAVGGFMVGVLLSGGILATPSALGRSISILAVESTLDVDQLTNCPPSESVATPGADDSIAAPPPVTPANSTHGSFQICGSGNAQLEREIEQLIAGRSFSVSLRSHGNECSELEVDVVSGAPGGGRQSSTMTVGVGGNRSVTLRIVSEAGQTSVSITGGA